MVITRGAAAVVLVGSALAAAACGGGNSSRSSTDSSSTASSSKAAKFSQCIRAHGVPDFPDPGANGKISLKVTKGSDLGPNSPAFKSAEQACKSLRPAGFGGGGAQSVANQNKLLQFVGCMRKHGVPNMPDPTSSGAMIVTGGQGINPNSPQFQSAMQTCRKLLPGGGTGLSGSQGG